MKINTNHWNQWRYALYSPIYDRVASYFDKQRKRSIELLDIQPGDTVLIIGAGTGSDLQFLPDFCEITATDITPAMLAKLEIRRQKLEKSVVARVMDGQKLNFEDNKFDKVILHLILAVIPDAEACLLEAQRVCKPGGKITVLDKFLPMGKKSSRMREALNILTNMIATNINRNFEDILSQTILNKTYEEEAGWNGNFRIIQLAKPS